MADNGDPECEELMRNLDINDISLTTNGYSNNMALEDYYEKLQGGGGCEGNDFQIDLLSVILLNALRNEMKDWRLSTDNKRAGKFDDLVLELSDNSAFLLQAKHRLSKCICKELLFSTDPKSDDFSLANYFSSFLEITNNFPKIQSLIICTNTNAKLDDDDDINSAFNKKKIGKESMLYCKDNTECITFGVQISSDLIDTTKNYRANKGKVKENKRKKPTKYGEIEKQNHEVPITREDVEMFLEYFQLHLNYPWGGKLQRIIEKELRLGTSGKNWRKLCNIPFKDVCQKMREWYKELIYKQIGKPTGRYMTESRGKALLCEIKSDKYKEKLAKHNISFKPRNFNLRKSDKSILHIVTNGEYMLPLIRMYHDMQDDEDIEPKTVLYVHPKCDVQEQTINSFALPEYTYLIIIMPEFENETIQELGTNLKGILESDKKKKVIFLTELNNKFVKQMKSLVNNYVKFNESLTLDDFSEESQKELLTRENIVFQGKPVSLQELLSEQIIAENKRYINSEILGKLFGNEKITVGAELMELDENLSKYYIKREFEANGDTQRCPAKRKTISEENFYHVSEKMILISDSTGSGKSTVLTNLASELKRKNPELWVMKIDISQVVLSKLSKSKTNLSVWDLLNYKDKSPNALEKFVFSLKGMVVLLLDGLDGIISDYKKSILKFLLQCQKMENFAKVFVTTRTHFSPELETELHLKSYRLVPLKRQNQKDYFKKYWTHNLHNLKNEELSECKRCTEILVHKLLSKVTCLLDEIKFGTLPLYMKMLADIFVRNIDSQNWRRCHKHLSGNEKDLNLPERTNILKLYETFMEQIRNIFMERENPRGLLTLKQRVIKEFHTFNTWHMSLSLEVILDEEERAFFSCYKPNMRKSNETMLTVLDFGIIQKLGSQLTFTHRTFAEYFVALSIQRELQIPNEEAEFQKFLIDKVFSLGKYKIVRQFLENILQETTSPLSPDIFETYKSLKSCNNNIIHMLAEEGNTEIIRLILNLITVDSIPGTSNWPYSTDYLRVNIEDDQGRTPLHFAVNGCLDTVKFLVEMKADVNRTCKLSSTPLHLAVDKQKYDIVQFLLTCGANIDVANKDGYTALHLASQSGNFDIAKMLVEKGANINSINQNNHTALHLAVEGDHFEIVELLIEKDVSIDIADGGGNTIMHFAAEGGSESIFKLLMKHSQVDLDVVNYLGDTLLHTAARSGNFLVVQALSNHYIEHKERAKIDRANVAGCTALHMAAKAGNLKIVDYLLKNGAYINVRDRRGETALHYAVRSGLNLVKFLVERGVDIDRVSNDGCSALDLAIQIGAQSIVNFLRRRGDVERFHNF